jgi:flagellar hook-associated protein 1
VLGNILNIARSAINVHQTGVQVTGQNLSNAQTEGYSRQRANLETTPPIRYPGGALGTGVRVADISRSRDALLDTTFRREAGNAAGFGLRRDLLGQVEEIFGELDDAGFSRTLDAFWSSWSDMASNPTNGSVRGLIVLNARQVTQSLHNFSARLEDLKHTTNERVSRLVADVNTLGSKLADVNRQLRVMEGLGRSAPDLQDERDRILDGLSRIVPVQVVERSDRTIGVYVGTVSLVDGAEWREMRLEPDADARGGVRIGASLISPSGGELGTLLAVRDDDIRMVQQRLDEFARQLVDRVNTAHSGAVVPDFFHLDLDPGLDPAAARADALARVSARSIRVADAITADPTRVGSVAGRPGDNRVALQVAQLREEQIAFAGGGVKSFGGFYGDIVADVGLRLNSANRSATVYESLAAQADVRRTTVSGVSTDEELMQLMRHQQAYAAATRLISVADEMLRSIIALGRS